MTKSHRCCPRCESQMSENCEYFGRIHYNGEMWYTQGCQHCACNSGRVICMNVQCQSQFCLRDEIMVRKKDECCISCRKPAVCRLDHDNKTLIKVFKLKIKKNTKRLRQPGVEPGSAAWKATMITATPLTLACFYHWFLDILKLVNN